MYDIPFEVFNEMVHSHLNSRQRPLSYFSSWTHSPLLLLSQAKARARQWEPHEVNISIMITSRFKDKDIYHVPDILKVGLSQSESDHRTMYPHEYLVHGPVSGDGFLTISLPVFIRELGPLWDNLDELDYWSDRPTASFEKLATNTIQEELEGCEKVAGIIAGKLPLII